MTPLVTCICPTANRRDFLRAAIALFAAQDYPAKELVIVESGQGNVSDFFHEFQDLNVGSETIREVTREGGIRYVCIGGGAEWAPQFSIGAKRNWACGLARGSLIAHWDDDDWHSPRRLSIQIAAMRAARARLCGMDRLVFYRAGGPCFCGSNSTAPTQPCPGGVHEPQAWLYRSDDPGFLAGGSLIYERSLWQEQPFEARSSGEDTMFVRKAIGRGVRVARIANEKLYVARVHAGNTDKKQPDKQWGKFDVARVRRWIGESETA